MELIPGLPNDVAVDCLIRLPFNQFSEASSVCKDWNLAVHELPEFWQRRKAAGFTEPIIVTAQAQPNHPQNGRGFSAQLAVYVPEREFWYELPPIPACFEGFPMFCQLVGVGKKLVVLGGCDPVTWKVLNSAYVYDFLTATWRQGADMPGEPRLFFGCASDSDRTVLVAGGHDDSKNALKSAMVYDVAKDEWVLLPDMASERDECKVVFHRGKFHVIGGYCTQKQGGFEKHGELFNIQTGQWDQIKDVLVTATCPRTCVGDGDGGLYMWREGDVAKRRNSTWEMLAELPADVHGVAHMTSWQGELYVISPARSSGGSLGVFVINRENGSLTKTTEAPHKYSGHVQSVASLEI